MKKVEFKNSQGLNIVGLLDLPEKGENFPIIICLHGFGGNKENNQEFSDLLNPLGIATLRIDFQGTGESAGKYEDKTTTGFMNDAKAALDFVYSLPKINKNKIGILGHSMGGTIAILLASMDSRIKTLIASCPAINIVGVIAGLYVPDDFSNSQTKGYIENRTNGEIKRLNFNFFEDANKYNLAQKALDIPYKFLILGAKKDTIVPFEQIEKFCEKVSNAELLILANSEHNLEEDWPITKYAIVDWFTNFIK